ncbi:MAG TPA: hypothetical protein VKN14_01500, partial [Flavobacteriaceae bacterium]|nr:hypothetical protein [Flavobacteriaceae bacterium]
NLGFIDFTDVVYSVKKESVISKEFPNSAIIYFAKKSISFNGKLIKLEQLNTLEGNLVLSFDSSLTFQDYIMYKSLLLRIDSPNMTIISQEFIY